MERIVLWSRQSQENNKQLTTNTMKTIHEAELAKNYRHPNAYDCLMCMFYTMVFVFWVFMYRIHSIEMSERERERETTVR